MAGRIDVHCHLLPGVDDGCRTTEESLTCARLLVQAGYAHVFCTPHIWADHPHNNVDMIALRTAELQKEIRKAGIPLELLPGGEIYLQNPLLLTMPDEEIVTLGLNRRFALADFWADDLTEMPTEAIRRLQRAGLKVILAHPERLKCFHADPPAVQQLLEMDLLLQGNLQCFSEPWGSANRTTVERFLLEDRYFTLGSDTHQLDTLPMRLDGLLRAVELVGRDAVAELTISNPGKLLPTSAFD